MTLIPRTRGGALARFALGAVLVIALAATTTAVAGLEEFKTAAGYIGQTPPLAPSKQVTVPDPGNPQTILIIGSDHRAGTSWNSSNTDTMMLVRLDPSSSTINVLSIPRDLKVQIAQGGGIVGDAKLNQAYSLGGPNLLLQILNQQVFPGLQVSHIVDVNFGGFQAIVGAIGCVYTDVDHRYYNNTAYTDYSSIDLQPGYQKLCGPDALSFVRFRHTDSDIVRNARQQDFIRWAKDQYGQASLISNRDTLLKIFGKYVQTDHNLHTVDGLINLFNLVAFSAGHAIKQIKFPAILLPCGPAPAVATPATPQTPCYLSADPGAEAVAFHQLMTPTVAAPSASASSATGPPKTAAPRPGRASGLTADPADAKQQAAALAGVGMPVLVPRLIASGANYCTNATCAIGPVANSYPRAYTLHDQSGAPHVAYRLTVEINPILGQYYGIQGTTWQRPPLLASPTQTVTVAGKRLMEFFNGHKLTVVAWRTPQGTYWVSNTLTDDLTNTQLVGIAASLATA